MRVVVVGGGLSGLVASRGLVAAGHDVIVLDKGRSPGGRLATRRIAGATLDHGAQFFTVRSDPFAALVQGWRADGVVDVWCRGFGTDDGHPRYRVAGGMNALAKQLANGLDVRCEVLAFAVRPTGRGWEVVLDDATVVEADAVVITTPVPQALSLLVPAGITLPDGLRSLDYDPTLALLAVLDAPSSVPPPGGVQEADEVFSWVADNQAKGISTQPAVTLHARPAWSAARWDDPFEDTHAALLDAARPWFGGARVVESHLKRWRFATPIRTWPEPCHVVAAHTPLVLGGDAFAGPKMEGAALSGLAVATALR